MWTLIFFSSIFQAALAAPKINSRYADWPSYADLPLDASYPTKAAWGVWGKNDSHGALNHIDADTILNAAKEIQLGEAIPLNLELDTPDPPVNPTRKPLVHLFQPESGYTDDVVVMNTQISTQYDGLRHFPYSDNGNVSTYQWYNNLIPNYDDVIGSNPTTVLGIQEAAQKGIAGRAVLLDWASYAEAHGILYDAFSARAITSKELDQVAAWQGLKSDWSLPGDILILRTGWVKAYRALSRQEQQYLPYRNDSDSTWIGMEASDASAEWLWNKKLCLVGADNPAFESVPFNGTIDGDARSLHQLFIGGWGQSIMEFLDLEKLAERAKTLKRYTFFLTVQNLNVVGGIASPPNAMALL